METTSPFQSHLESTLHLAAPAAEPDRRLSPDLPNDDTSTTAVFSSNLQNDASMTEAPSNLLQLAEASVSAAPSLGEPASQNLNDRPLNFDIQQTNDSAPHVYPPPPMFMTYPATRPVKVQRQTPNRPEEKVRVADPTPTKKRRRRDGDSSTGSSGSDSCVTLPDDTILCPIPAKRVLPMIDRRMMVAANLANSWGRLRDAQHRRKMAIQQCEAARELLRSVENEIAYLGAEVDMWATSFQKGDQSCNNNIPTIQC